MKTKFKLLLLFLFAFSLSYAQTVTGVVKNADDGMPLPGVNVIIRGTTNGTMTDFDGNYSLKVVPGDVLDFSSLGFKTYSVTISNQTTIDVVMETDVESLDEVVVIGYGTQRKADLTGSITTIKAEEVANSPTSNINQALQGKVAGLQVTSSGAPGVSANVRIRGIGSYSTDGRPLYVVDGMFYSDIDFLNTSDIASVNVLKDASSTAIFGVKGSGGVIVIETKSGGYEKKAQFTYEGYTGMQYAQNVLKMANAEQFVTMVYETESASQMSAVAAAIARFGRSRINPNLPNVNTDWYKEVLQAAPMMSHSMSYSGGSSNVSYSAGVNYFSQDGILDYAKNEYERFNIRGMLNAKLSDKFNLGANFVVSNATQFSAPGSAWNQIYYAVPILPVYDDLNIGASPTRFANAKDLGYRGTQNPIPTLINYNNRTRKREVLGNFFLEYNLYKDKLKLKTNYNVGYRPREQRVVNLPYSLGFNDVYTSSITVNTRNGESILSPGFNQIWDNTLTYTDQFGDHALTALVGSSLRDEQYNIVTASGADILGVDDEDNWTINNTALESRTSGSYNARVVGMSYFTRLQYSYKDRYLINGTLRADGVSKYTGKKWGYFPAVGIGWVVTEENFMNDNGLFDNLKLRASWGRLGNDKISPSSGSNTTSLVNVDIGDVQTSGTVTSSTFSNLKWEFVEEMDFGLSALLFDRRLSLEADYYIRDTKDAVFPVYQPIVSLYIDQNSGVIRNQGVEIAANWNQQISDKFGFNVGFNISTLKNEVTKLYGQDYIDGGSAEFRQRSQVGEAVRSFFGYEVAGVYQTQDEVDNDPLAQTAGVALAPGDFRYVDQNGDGVINDDDRVFLGSYLPNFTYGANLGFNYGNFEFSVSVFGQTGNKILNRKRAEVIWTPDLNMDADLAVNRWHGPGTSNSYPSAAGRLKGWNQKMSTFLVEDGDFFRIQNIQLAYTIQGKKLLGTNMPDTKIIFTAERPFTSFKYNGFNPEVDGGIDSQTYPIPAVYTLGLNIKI